MILLHFFGQVLLIFGILISFGNCLDKPNLDKEQLIQFYLHRPEAVSTVDITQPFQIKYFEKSETAGKYLVEFQIYIAKENITFISDQFRMARRLSHGPGWRKSPVGWEFYFQNYDEEKMVYTIDTLSNTLDYYYETNNGVISSLPL